MLPLRDFSAGLRLADKCKLCKQFSELTQPSLLFVSHVALGAYTGHGRLLYQSGIDENGFTDLLSQISTDRISCA